MKASRLLAAVCGWAIVFVIARTVYQGVVVSQSLRIVQEQAVLYGSNAQESNTVFGIASVVAYGSILFQATLMSVFYLFAVISFRKHQ